MIKALSPFVVTTPFVSPLTSATSTEYLLQIYVWSGDKASVPAEATYEKTILNTSNSIGNSKVNIARLINDFINFGTASSNITETLDGNNAMWVQHDVIYTTSNPTDDDVQQSIVTQLMVSGYGYGIEGENAQPPTNKVFMAGTEFDVNRAGFFSVPILVDEDTASQTATIISFPDNEINKVIALPDTNDSSELIQYLWVDNSETTTDTHIEVGFNGVTITLFITEECRYTPIDIAFQNKEGQQQILTFFKKRVDSMAVTNEVFEGERGQPSEGNHQFIKFNVNGKSKLTVNTGFIDEDVNETIKQLFLSERVWEFDGTNFIPLNISSTTFEEKTRQNDRLINYEIAFDFAFNEVNTI